MNARNQFDPADTLRALQTDFNAHLLRIRLRIGVVVALCVAAYAASGWVSAEMAELDARRVSELGREYVESELPTLQQDLSRLAELKAPEVVSSLRDGLLDLPPILRKQTQAALLRGITSGLAEIESWLDRSVTELIVHIESEEQMNEEALAEFRRTYCEYLESALMTLSSRVDDAANEASAYLARLREEEPLSPREETELKMIQTALALYGST